MFVLVLISPVPDPRDQVGFVSRIAPALASEGEAAEGSVTMADPLKMPKNPAFWPQFRTFS
jgi:hypothetical protein